MPTLAYQHEIAKDRMKHNNEIMQALWKYLEEYPYMRFGQALYALNILSSGKDIFYDESNEIYSRMKKES